MQPYPPGGIGWYRQRADADRGQPGLLAKILLTVCTGGATDIAVPPEGGEQAVIEEAQRAGSTR
jgi:hypothetical protein